MSMRSARSSHTIHLLLLAAGLLTAGALWGCDTAVDLADEPTRAFTLWGAVNPQADTQTIKVFPMGTRLERIKREEFPATLTSENLETGRTRTWRDSLVREKNGRRTHVYWAPFSPEYDHSFRIEASSEEQGTASATPAIPPWVELEVLSIDAFQGVEVRVPPEAPQVLPRATLYYTVKFGTAQPDAEDPVEPEDVITTVQLTVPVERQGDGWLVETQLDEDAHKVDRRLEYARDTLGIPPREKPGCCKLDLLDFHVEVQIVDRAWTFPGDTLHRASVTQPDALSNVENGFGLVGAGYDQLIEVEVPEEVGEDAGFGAALCSDECYPDDPVVPPPRPEPPPIP